MSTPVVILVRVSTAKQITDRQEYELLEAAKQKGWNVIEVCREKISGSAHEDDRHGLARVMELARSGKIKKVLVHEISRLARRPALVHTTVEELSKLGVSLFWKAQQIETLLDDGKRSQPASIMLALLAEMARAETDLLSERVRSGLDEARRRGTILGRKPGKLPPAAILERNAPLVATIRKYPNATVRDLARFAKKSPNTVMKVQRLMNQVPTS